MDPVLKRPHPDGFLENPPPAKRARKPTHILTNAQTVAWGFYHGFAVTRCGLFCWGKNDHGQLGLGHRAAVLEPQKHPLPNVISVFCGGEYTFAFTKDGTTYCWGKNKHGQLGLGHNIDQITPQKFPLENIFSIFFGPRHSFALTKNGIFGWGYNEKGQLGLGHRENLFIPRKWELLENVTSFSCGGNHTMAITKDGALFAWGSNKFGQLGIGGRLKESSLPVSVPSIADAIQASCGYHHSTVLTEKGLFSWGSNTDGQAGLGHTNLVWAPVLVDLPKVKSVSCGSFHTCVVTEFGSFGWGRNTGGQLGVGHQANLCSPQKIKLDALSISSFSTSNFAWTKNGLFSWGFNGSGELGLSHKRVQQTPQLVSLPGIISPFQENTLLSNILRSNQYSDVEICGIKAHKAMIACRSPRFFSRDHSDVSLEVMEPFLKWVYTDQIDETLPVLVLCDLIKLANIVELPELIRGCQALLLESLTHTNAFLALSTCAQKDLETEVNFVIWYIARQKAHFTPSVLAELSPISVTRPELFCKLLNEYASPTLPEPMVPLATHRPIEEDLEGLFESGLHADFILKFGSPPVEFKLHSFILSSWSFFTVLKHSDEHRPKTGLPADVFRKILRYLYCKKLDTISMRDAVWVLIMKEYYMFDNDSPLVEYCEAATQINSSNWIEGYQIGKQLNQESLVKQSIAASCATDPQIVKDIFALFDKLEQKEEIINGLKEKLEPKK